MSLSAIAVSWCWAARKPRNSQPLAISSSRWSNKNGSIENHEQCNELASYRSDRDRCLRRWHRPSACRAGTNRMLSNIQVKLLIVDDLPENLLALEALIRREDCIVYKALSADEALSLLLQHEFAMAILDVKMPGMNGFELAELMRGTEKTRNIPIVFVSAAGRELNYAFKGYESGAVDFLHKPLDIHAVKSKVNVFVDLYRQSKAMKEQVLALEQSRREQEALLEQLQNTRLELQQAVRMRDDFMSIVAHE